MDSRDLHAPQAGESSEQEHGSVAIVRLSEGLVQDVVGDGARNPGGHAGTVSSCCAGSVSMMPVPCAQRKNAPNAPRTLLRVSGFHRPQARMYRRSVGVTEAGPSGHSRMTFRRWQTYRRTVRGERPAACRAVIQSATAASQVIVMM